MSSSELGAVMQTVQRALIVGLIQSRREDGDVALNGAMRSYVVQCIGLAGDQVRGDLRAILTDRLKPSHNQLRQFIDKVSKHFLPIPGIGSEGAVALCILGVEKKIGDLSLAEAIESVKVCKRLLDAASSPSPGEEEQGGE